MTRYMTITEAAKVLGVTRQMAHVLLKSGELRPVRVKVLRRSDVERLASRRARKKERERLERERRAAIAAAVRKVGEQFNPGGGEGQ